jgi:hypothetical protein
MSRAESGEGQKPRRLADFGYFIGIFAGTIWHIEALSPRDAESRALAAAERMGLAARLHGLQGSVEFLAITETSVTILALVRAAAVLARQLVQ